MLQNKVKVVDSDNFFIQLRFKLNLASLDFRNVPITLYHSNLLISSKFLLTINSRSTHRTFK